MQNLDTQKMKDLYVKAKDAYYNTDSPLMSDDEFDELVEVLKTSDPTFIDYVGSSNKEDKYLHRSKMLSLPKVQMKKTSTNLLDYDTFADELLKYNFINSDTLSLLEVTPKFDGVSINIQYAEDGRLLRAITRGDKEKGRDITHRVFSKIPHNLTVNDNGYTGIVPLENYTYELRGEVLMNKYTFEEKYSAAFKNPRNLVSGILSNKTNDGSYDDLDVLIFELRIYKNNTLHEIVGIWKLNTLYKHLLKESNIVQDAFYIKPSKQDLIDTYDKMNDIRKRNQYQLDGFVIKVSDSDKKLLLGENDHHPKWAVACKFIPKLNVTSIVDINWHMGKTGEYCPVAELEPIDLDGSTIRNTTLHNYGKVKSAGLSIGAKVSIEKKGDIIPQISEIIEKSTVDFSHPIDCVHCSNPLEIENDIHLICKNDRCSGILKFKFRSACTTLKIDFLGGKNSDKLYDSGLFVDIFECFDSTKMTYDNLVNVAGFADGKIANRIILEFKNKRSFNLSQIVEMLEIDNVGSRMSEQIARYQIGDADFTGLEKEIIESFKNGKNKILLEDALERLNKYGVEVKYPEKIISQDLLYYEMTGSPVYDGGSFRVKKEFMDYAEQFGFKYGSLKNASYLITDSYSSSSNKMETARKKGIEIITYEDFVSRFK